MQRNADIWRRHNRHVFLPVPCRNPVIAKGSGAWVEDIEGKRYLDMGAGQFSAIFGHSDPGLARVMAAQSKRVLHTNDYLMSEPVLEAMRALAAVAPKGMGKSILLSTGAEANECAFRIAKACTGRNGIVGFDKGYYGLTVATQSITAGGRFADPKVPNMRSIPVPDPCHVPAGLTQAGYETECLAQSERILTRMRGGVALFIFEPVLSAGGMIFPRPAYLRKLAPLIRKTGALLAFDEAQTGMGRTGRWFGAQRYAVRPDMLVLSKGLGCGLPVSAVLLRNAVAEKIEGRFLHFSSHQNDPLAGAVVCYAVNRIKRERLLRHIRTTGACLLEQLRRLAAREPWLVHPRGEGLMLAFELDRDAFNARKEYNLGFMLQDLLEEEGVLIQAIARGRIFRLLPPYTISRKDIHFFLRKLAKCVRRLREEADLPVKLAARNRKSVRHRFHAMFHPAE
ncbi:MAG: aspartate aminotransferase family protein [Kiritimatiellae bacterium]|nr:aspartate aminotransferase family protein [Kiritimatiellia bacterium]